AYGWFRVGTGVSNTGSANATDQALYFQDAWTVGSSGLTLNLGVRMDEEKNPAFDPNRFPSLNFSWGDKIAPRLGGAYDVLHNGSARPGHHERHETRAKPRGRCRRRLVAYAELDTGNPVLHETDRSDDRRHVDHGQPWLLHREPGFLVCGCFASPRGNPGREG